METSIKKFHIITYGCQMNIHESEKIAGILAELGYSNTTIKEEADIIVFNTCCIRENAEQKADGNIGALKSLKQKKSDLIIAVCGCMTQQKGEAERLHKRFPFIDIIFGTHNLENFKTLLNNKLVTKKKIIEILDKEQQIVEGTPKLRSSFPNAWVNVMYGCNNFCSYCIVPYVRGRERSRKPEDIINECKCLIKNGYKEITLLGQNVNSYGKDLTNVDFATLVRQIADIEGNFRLSFMTNHPKDLTEDLVSTIAENEKISRSIHLPIQSGSNRILKLMNRKYTREEYLQKIDMIKNKIPDISITTDIMVGFPTETEEDFNDTLDIVRKVKYSGAFTFVYSKRKGTPAEKMDGQIDESVSKHRIMRLIETQNEIAGEEAKKRIGTVSNVLCEGYDEKKEKYMGRDNNGRMVYFDGKPNDFGCFISVMIKQTSGISLFGEKFINRKGI